MTKKRNYPYLVLSKKFTAPFFALKGLTVPYILAFTASAPHGRLAVGSHSLPECPPGGGGGGCPRGGGGAQIGTTGLVLSASSASGHTITL